MSVCVSNCPAAATMSIYVCVNADFAMAPSQLTCDTADDSDDQDDGRPHHSAGSQSLSLKVQFNSLLFHYCFHCLTRIASSVNIVES